LRFCCFGPPAICKVNDEQKAKIKAIRGAWRQEVRDVNNAGKAKYDQLTAELKATGERKDQQAAEQLKKKADTFPRRRASVPAPFRAG